MNKFQLVLKTPFTEVFDGEVENIYVVTKIGEIGVFADHVSMMSPITFSFLSVNTGNSIKTFMVRSGILHFVNSENKCIILAYLIEDKENIDVAGTKSYLAKIDEILSNSSDLSEYSFKLLENERIALVQQIEASS